MTIRYPIFKAFNYLLLAFTLLLITSCKKNEESPVPAKQILMTLNFTGNFINPKLAAVVFASDVAGNLIADTLIRGNGKVQLYSRQGVSIPSKFVLTIATWEPSMHNFNIFINSYLYVSPSEWTLQGHRSDTLGHFTISLFNLPPQPGLILYSNAGYANLTTMTENLVNLSYIDPDDVYIRMETTSGPRYKWVDNIHPGESYHVDMSVTEAPVLQTIKISGAYCEARVWGFKTADYENELPIMTDEWLNDVPSGNAIQVASLPGHFSGYHADLKLIEDWSSFATYTCRTTGSIPASFRKTTATVTDFITGSPGKVVVYTAGNFTMTAANWQFNAQNNQFFNWTVYGADTVTHFQVPSLSTAMRENFPSLAIDSLIFDHIELMEFTGLDSYDDFLAQVFNPENPRSPDYLDASTMIYGQHK